MTFEERVERLERIAAELEGATALANALSLFEEGVALLREATAELGDAEARVQRLVEGLDGAFEVSDG